MKLWHLWCAQSLTSDKDKMTYIVSGGEINSIHSMSNGDAFSCNDNKIGYSVRNDKVTAQALQDIQGKNDWRDGSSNVSWKQILTTPTWRSAAVFHSRAAATGKARSPMVERWVRGTTSDDVDVDVPLRLNGRFTQWIRQWVLNSQTSNWESPGDQSAAKKRRNKANVSIPQSNPCSLLRKYYFVNKNRIRRGV